MENKDYMVYVKCMTYNHSKYITSAMNGFCMQKTTFPFICTIIDDASTDNEQNVIKSYFNEHFNITDSVAYQEDTDEATIMFAQHKENHNCHFAIVLLKENHTSQKKSKKPYIKRWNNNIPYIAPCEGDDYWIDATKLQRQVEWMEQHPEYTMCVTDARIMTTDGEQDWHRYDTDSDITPEEMILGGGLYIQTASLLYRTTLLDNYPECCKKCHVGDYPLQIWASLQGKVRYFADKMITYRFGVPGSWTTRNSSTKIKLKLPRLRSEIDMLQELDKYSDYKFHDTFINRQCNYVYNILTSDKSIWKEIATTFHDVIQCFDKNKKVENWLMLHEMEQTANLWHNYPSIGLKETIYSLPIIRYIVPRLRALKNCARNCMS